MEYDDTADRTPPRADQPRPGEADGAATTADRPAPPRPDPTRLQRLLDGEHAGLRDRVREALRRQAPLLREAVDLPRAEYRDRALAAVRDLADDGIANQGLPRQYGGGGDLAGTAVGFQALAAGDLSVLIKLGVQFGLFGGAVLQLGTRHHYADYLARIASGELLGCFAMTEVGHGSDVQSIRTTATYDAAAGEFEIHTPDAEAQKEYIGGAARHARAAVVFAQLYPNPDADSEGVHALVVPLRDDDGNPLPGISFTDDGAKIGLNGVDNGRIAFDRVRVPRTALLDRYAAVGPDGTYHSPIDNKNRRFFTMLGTLVQGRVSVAGAALTAAQTALTIAVRYSLTRRQFPGGKARDDDGAGGGNDGGGNNGDSGGDNGGGDNGGADGRDAERLLLDYPLHRRRLLPLVAHSYAWQFAQDELVAELDAVLSGPVTDPDTWHRDDSDEAEQRRRALESRAAGTKALATWHAARTIQECREACGGAGYMWENRFGALRADTDVFTTFEGDNHVLLQLVGKGMLTAYAAAFNDLDQLGTVRFVAERALETVIERTSAHRFVQWISDVFRGDERWDIDAGVRDPNYQLAMFRWREEHQLTALARRIKQLTDQGVPDDEVSTRVQTHLVACGRSHLERLTLEAFVAAYRRLGDGDEKRTLNLLCDLHALAGIEADRGWWLEHGRLTADRSKEISRTVDALVDQVRPLAADLVTAFGIPDECCAAPMLDR